MQMVLWALPLRCSTALLSHSSVQCVCIHCTLPVVHGWVAAGEVQGRRCACVAALQVRSRTSRWGLGTSSARALRFDRVDKVFNRTADNPPDTDPAFDPEADAARIRAETAAKAQVPCLQDDLLHPMLQPVRALWN